MPDNATPPPDLDEFFAHTEQEDCENCAASGYGGAVCEHIAALGDISGLGEQRLAFHASACLLAWMVEMGYDTDAVLARLRTKATELMSAERYHEGSAGTA